MDNQSYLYSHLSGVFHTGLFCIRDGQLISYEESPEYNPLYENEALRRTLMCRANAQEEPVVQGDAFRVVHICVKAKQGYYMMGPFCMQVMGRAERHRFYHFYGVDEKWEKGLHCTTCVESEAYARSECHGWGALILYELPAITLGVRPAAPGYKKVRIAPVPGYLTSASGTVKTPVGNIRVSWKIEAGAFKIDYEVPQDVEVVR